MLSSLTVTEAHAKLKKKQITSVELTKSCIERIEAVDGKIHAVVYQDFERALARAKKIDDQGKFSHVLTGIPYLTKDVFCEEGVPTTGCSNVLREKNYIPPFDSTTTKRLKAVGAISLGKANTDEFTMGSSTESSCYGVTRNPWDLTRVAGGSSGGPAAGVRSDECLFSIGTDTGGSTRQPASFCSVTGLRATYGRTSRFGVMSMASSLDTIGPLTKNTEDMAIVLEAIAGRDPLDGTTGDVPVPDYTSLLKPSVKGLKVGVPKEYFIDGMDPEVEKAVREAVTVLKNLGAKIIDISLPHTKYAIATYYVLCPCEVSSNMARYDGIRYGSSGSPQADQSLIEYYEHIRSEGFGAEVKRRIMIGTYALSAGYYDAYYRQAQKMRTLICRDFTDAFAKVDVILSPVAPTPAFPVGAHASDPVTMYLEDAFTIGAVMAGIPAMSVPCGFAKKYHPACPSEARKRRRELVEGLPIGLQLMAPQWQEGVMLQAAYAYEQATEWHKRKPKLA